MKKHSAIFTDIICLESSSPWYLKQIPVVSFTVEIRFTSSHARWQTSQPNPAPFLNGYTFCSSVRAVHWWLWYALSVFDDLIADLPISTEFAIPLSEFWLKNLSIINRPPTTKLGKWSFHPNEWNYSKHAYFEFFKPLSTELSVRVNWRSVRANWHLANWSQAQYRKNLFTGRSYRRSTFTFKSAKTKKYIQINLWKNEQTTRELSQIKTWLNF